MKENTEGNKKQLLEIQATDLLLRFTTNESKITVLAYLISQAKAILCANKQRAGAVTCKNYSLYKTGWYF